MVSSLSIISAAAALLTPVLAQSSCNPTQGSCPPDPALGKAVFYDFTKGTSDDFTLSTGAFPTFNSTGAEFTIAKHLDSPTLSSKWYIMYGHYDIVLQTAPGQGVVSSSVLISDTRDEIDLEWVGNQANSLQCNFFGQAKEGSEKTVTATNEWGEYHTYSIDWTPQTLTWAVDGNVLRSIPSSASNYPQSPMQLKIGTWPGGDPSEAPGTISWAGGPINYNNGPFTMFVKNVTVYDYSTGSSYAYSGTSGSADSISATGGKIGAYSSIQGMTVTTAQMNDPSSTASSVASSATSVVASTPASSVSPIQVPSTSSAPAQVSTPSTLSTVVQSPTSSSTPSSVAGSPTPTGVTSVVPVASSPAPSPTSTGSGSGSGTGTSDIPPAIQSEIAAIGKKNPGLAAMLESIWAWISSFTSSKKW